MFKKHNGYLTFSLMIGMILVLTQTAYASEKGSAKGSEKGSMLEQKGSPAQEMDPAMAEMMQKYEAYSKPNENHKILDKLVGDWNHTVRWWMEPNGQADESAGTSSIKWIMDGRFIQQEVKGSHMGKSFTGIGITGYDNVKQKYITIWLDSMATGVMTGEGIFDPKTKKIGDAGNYSCPLTSGQRNYRAVTTFIDDNNFMYEMYMTDLNGNEFRSMEIKYTRS